jgi:Xaa-Pro aminopeptidase
MSRAGAVRRASGPAHAASERLGRAAGELRARELDVLLVTGAVNVRYTTGFTGTSGLALIDAHSGSGAGAAQGSGSGGGAEGPLGHRFITDFRYATQAAEQVAPELERTVVSDSLLEGVAGVLPAGGGRLGFSEKALTVADHSRLRERLGDKWELAPAGDVLEGMRAVKDAAEIARIRAACELADEALRAVLDAGLAGRTEREVALELEWQMRRRGAEGPSFTLIVAAGAHAALPHASPRELEIGGDELVIVDWGALHEGYCSDCTRTFATGERIGERAREIYEVVRAAQELAARAVRAGAGTRELDGIARAEIERAGYGKEFGHGLGHGVGMEIHEGPRLSRSAPEVELLAGNVVTVEPGVYVPGELGVRIEDLVVVGDSESEALTSLPKELTVVS